MGRLFQRTPLAPPMQASLQSITCAFRFAATVLYRRLYLPDLLAAGCRLLQDGRSPSRCATPCAQLKATSYAACSILLKLGF